MASLVYERENCTDYTNPSQKLVTFTKMLFKLEEFENAGWTENIAY